MNNDYIAAARQLGSIDYRCRQALGAAVLCETRLPVLYVVLELPPALCGDHDSVDGLFAFVFPRSYPFQPPLAWLLTKGVFVPSSACRVSNKGVRISKVPALADAWSPALTIEKVCVQMMAELADITKWSMYLTRKERECLPALHASCVPCTLQQTLERQEWMPTEFSRLGRQWYGLRVTGLKVRVPQEVTQLIESYVGKLALLLQASRSSSSRSV
jgi:hypothetical protein